MANKINKKIFKMTADELQEYMMTMKRGYKVPAKKGKGSFKRHNKHKGMEVE